MKRTIQILLGRTTAHLMLLTRSRSIAFPAAIVLTITIAIGSIAQESPARKAESAAPKSAKSNDSGEETPVADAKDEWRLFRGDPAFHAHRDVEISRSPRLLFRHDTGERTSSSPTIAAGRIYIGTESGKLLAFGLEPREGKAEALFTYEAESAIRASPSFHEGRLYFGDMFGVFHCVDATTGKQEWKLDTQGSEIIASANFFKDSKGRDLVIFGTYDGLLWAVDARKGEEVWTFEAGGPIHASPAISGATTCIAGCDESVRIVDLETGKEKAQLPMGAYTPASPVFAGTRIYVGTHASEVLGFDWKSGEKLWTYQNPRRSFPFSSSPALSGDRLVVGGEDKLVHCIDRRTGDALWTFPTRAKVEASPLIAGKVVIIGSGDKNLYLLELESGKEIWRYEADGAFVGSAALARGRLVATTQSGTILCFDVTSR
ncbi:MAG TPA: PQQ-binding-like beta-propeller repeat protein [Planctomycetota bacterium]|nr:PQQ-binding-like beta-propeller repeat protein [Planctomycetota bacterium]